VPAAADPGLSTPASAEGAAGARLADGARVAIVGGGPAGSFSTFFLLQTAERIGCEVEVDVFEPRTFLDFGPKGCNMCGGIVSESLLQNLAAEGISLPPQVIMRRLDSYVLHMDVGTVRIATPLREMRIAAVHRGSGPSGCEAPVDSFDRHLLDLALGCGGNRIAERVTDVSLDNGRPLIETREGAHGPYDLMVVATGINSPALRLFEKKLPGYRPPVTTQARVCELHLGRWMIERYFGNAMHVFLLNIPRLEFAALIPKGEYVTACLLGEDVDRDLMASFLGSPEVKRCLPPHWRLPDKQCGCSPRMAIGSAPQPFGDRVVFVGDCGTTRLYKDGIGAAYRMAKAMVNTALFHGVSENDFRRHYWPACQGIIRDNGLGKLVFRATRQIQRRRPLRRGVWAMTTREQQGKTALPRMSSVLWDTFTGSATYRSVLRRSLHPAFLTRLLWETGRGVLPSRGEGDEETNTMEVTGFMGKKYHDGEVIYHQGERGDRMYVVQEGEVEIVRRQGDKEFCLSTLARGDIFGERAIFGKDARRATARAVGDVYVFTLEKDSLLSRLHEDASLAFVILQRLSRRIRDLEDSLMNKASSDWPDMDGGGTDPKTAKVS
jgi:flavin-dependent dehydrogenase